MHHRIMQVKLDIFFKPEPRESSSYFLDDDFVLKQPQFIVTREPESCNQDRRVAANNENTQTKHRIMQVKIDIFFKPEPRQPSSYFLDDDKVLTDYKRMSRDAVNDETLKRKMSKRLISQRPSLKSTASNDEKSLNSKRKYTQLHLELGQSDFLLRTCFTCGFKYAPGEESDEKVHSIFHRTCTHGVQFRGWRKERIIDISPGVDGRVIMVLNGDPPAHKKKVKDVVDMMEIEFGSGWALNKLCKVYLFVLSNRIAGCLVAEPIKCAYKVIPCSTDKGGDDFAAKKKKTTYSTTLQFGNVSFNREVAKKSPSLKDEKNTDVIFQGATICETESLACSCGVRAIWVSPSNRRKRIASHLLDALRNSFDAHCVIEKSELAFSQPTADGKALASAYTGNAAFLIYHSSCFDEINNK